MAASPRSLRVLIARRDWLTSNWRARNLGLALLAFALLVPLGLTPAYRLVEGRTFDLLSIVSPADLAAPGAVIVAIDEPSFSAIGERWPWSRDRHARLVQALRKAGAKVIGLDIVFSEPSTPEADAALAAAMGPDVVLAAMDEVIPMEQAVQVSRVGPLPILTARGAQAGVTSVDLDGDGVLRRMPPSGELFAEKLLAAAGAAAPTVPDGARIQYFGPARSYPTVSYYQAADPDAWLSGGGIFRDRIVLVGLSLKTPPQVDEKAADVFLTPFTLVRQTLTAGVEIHATILDNIRSGLAIRPVPGWAMALLTLAAGLAAALLAGPRTTLRSTAASVLLAIGLVLASWLVMRQGRVWAPPVLPVAAVAIVFLGSFAIDALLERRLRAAITSAFSRYVSPALVDELVKDPGTLKLGGQQRELTILFCDVRGFTGLSERLKGDPERLSAIINRLLDALSEEVLRQRGTIDKYMGDCVMAFWNAPLPDADHALHAVQAAFGMVQAVGRVNAELARDFGIDAPDLSVGIGINTGECMVGNMGSRWRYDYSVLGDSVNLASRLESLTKELGVRVVLGSETARIVGGRIALREIGAVPVRGRAEPARVYTPAVPHGGEA